MIAGRFTDPTEGNSDFPELSQISRRSKAAHIQAGGLPLPAINTAEGAREKARSGPAEPNNGPFCGGKALLLVSFTDDNMGLLVLFSYLCFLLDIY